MEKEQLEEMKKTLTEILFIINNEILLIDTPINITFEQYLEFVEDYVCENESDALSGLGLSKTSMKKILRTTFNIGDNKADAIIRYFIARKYIKIIKIGRKQILCDNKEQIKNSSFYDG